MVSRFFPTKISSYFTSVMHATCIGNLTLVDVIDYDASGGRRTTSGLRPLFMKPAKLFDKLLQVTTS
jgi:hypothetical protein